MIGKTILHYKILEKLGQGGMGVVYKAEDIKLDRTVAIKFLPKHIAGNSEERERFIIEARAAAALNHSNIATIHAIEESDDDMFIVMEYIEGEELKDLISQIPPVPPLEKGGTESPFEGGARRAGDVLPVDEILTYATQIASGLQAAHEKGIIHRDIKSSNIMITPKGQVKIMDFGLAKMSGSLHMTKADSTLGTPFYMSPEQTRGSDIDQRSDIWSFGVVLYEMLTGQLPFKGDYEQAIIYSILNEAPEAMTDVAPELVQVVLKALAKKPDERYQSADELAADLQAIGSGQSVKVKGAARPAKLIYWITAAVVVLIAIAFFLFRPASQPIPEKESENIAILPFADMSPKNDQEYFSDGMAEELINVLSRNPKLRVIARTSSFSFKGTNNDIKTIAAKLNVKNILEGSVRKAGNNLRISANLVNVETDATLWSDTYDGTLDNIFALQDSISGNVAEALRIALLGNETAKSERKTDPEAYNNFLLGNHFYDLRGKENWEKAEEYYEKALSIDSAYASAWVGLSRVHRSQADWAYLPVDEGYAKARKEVEKALELNPNLAAAHDLMGWIRQVYDWDWKGADESYQKALTLESGNYRVISNAAGLASTIGRFDEAITLDHRSIELNPVKTSVYHSLGTDCWYAGSLDESMAAYRKCLELNPQYPAVHMSIGRVFLDKGQPDSALAEMERETEPL